MTTSNATSKAGAERRPWIRGRLRPASLVVVLACVAAAGTVPPAAARVQPVTLPPAAAHVPAATLAATARHAPAIAHAAAGGSPRHVKVSQALSQLLYQHRVYRSAGTRAPLGRSLPANTPLTGERTTLPIVGYGRSPRRRWLRVMLPGRPNSSTGWIERGGTREIQTGWHIIVSTGRRRVWVYFDGSLLESYLAVVGKPSTPTPTGDFFVEETEIMPSTAPGGPYVLALSARSDVLQDFDGGPGQIGIHGRDLLGGTLGQAQSHGCMRLATADITWLADHIGPGVPVTIDE